MGGEVQTGIRITINRVLKVMMCVHEYNEVRGRVLYCMVIAGAYAKVIVSE